MTIISTMELDNEMECLRAENDAIDARILELLGRRMDNSLRIGRLKARDNLDILQLSRWQDVLQQVVTLGKSYNLSEEFLVKLYRLIHEESRFQQGGEGDRNEKEE